MRQAVIVSTARTPLTKAYRGEFNITPGPTLAAFAVRAAVDRAGIDPALIEDAVLGCGYPEGSTGRNLARQAIMRAGLPISIDAGGVENCSQIATRSASDSGASGIDPWIAQLKPERYLSMIETADIVAARYGISRGDQDLFSAESQRRTADAQQAGRCADEIVAVTTTMAVTDKDKGAVTQREVTVAADTCNRPGTTVESLAKLQPVRGEGQFITAGNSSQLSDGASACVMVEAREAERLGLKPLGAFLGLAVAGCEPDEMGIGPVFAVPKLLARHGLTVDDIGQWELNEAFASQALYCQRRLEIPSERLNVNGGSISIGHPFGMTGARLAGHVLIEGRRRGVKYAVVTM